MHLSSCGINRRLVKDYRRKQRENVTTAEIRTTHALTRKRNVKNSNVHCANVMLRVTSASSVEATNNTTADPLLCHMVRQRSPECLH